MCGAGFTNEPETSPAATSASQNWRERRKSRPRSELDSWCAEAGFVPYVAFEITEFDTVRSLVAHDLGVALLPRAEVPTPGVHTIPVDGTKERTIALATGTGELPPAVERLHRHIVTHARRALG